MAEPKTVQDSIVIDANIFRACVGNTVKKMICASSVSVYLIDLQQKTDAVFTEDIENRFI